MSAPEKVRVPLHLSENWIVQEAWRRKYLRDEGKSDKTIYIHPKRLSIREIIAVAEQLDKGK